MWHGVVCSYAEELSNNKKAFIEVSAFIKKLVNLLGVLGGTGTDV